MPSPDTHTPEINAPHFPDQETLDQTFPETRMNVPGILKKWQEVGTQIETSNKKDQSYTCAVVFRGEQKTIRITQFLDIRDTSRVLATTINVENSRISAQYSEEIITGTTDHLYHELPSRETVLEFLKEARTPSEEIAAEVGRQTQEAFQRRPKTANTTPTISNPTEENKFPNTGTNIPAKDIIENTHPSTEEFLTFIKGAKLLAPEEEPTEDLSAILEKLSKNWTKPQKIKIMVGEIEFVLDLMPYFEEKDKTQITMVGIYATSLSGKDEKGSLIRIQATYYPTLGEIESRASSDTEVIEFLRKATLLSKEAEAILDEQLRRGMGSRRDQPEEA